MRYVPVGVVGIVVLFFGCKERTAKDEKAPSVSIPEEVGVSPEERIDREMDVLRERYRALELELGEYDEGVVAWRRRMSKREEFQTMIDEYEHQIDTLLKAEKMAKELNAGLAQVIERAGLEPKHKTSDEFNRTDVFVNILERELRRLKNENEELRARLEEE